MHRYADRMDCVLDHASVMSSGGKAPCSLRRAAFRLAPHAARVRPGALHRPATALVLYPVAKPSRMLICLWHRAAMLPSCVEIRKVVPSSRLISAIRSITRSAESMSRLPVGSSARTPISVP